MGNVHHVTILLDAGAVRRGLGAMWGPLEVVAETGSTNADLLAAAADGVAEGTLLVAELQTAGRGRLDRSWQSPSGVALTFSFVLRPSLALALWGWLPLVVGLGVRDGVQQLGGSVELKWPNDIQIGPDRRKAGGILVQVAAAPSAAAVVGIGLNVVSHDGLPEGAGALDQQLSASREEILVAVLEGIAARYEAWTTAGGDAAQAGIAADYAAASSTLGSRVRVLLPDIDPVDGAALRVDDFGRLVVRAGDGSELVVAAGDVIHVRPTD